MRAALLCVLSVACFVKPPAEDAAPEARAPQVESAEGNTAEAPPPRAEPPAPPAKPEPFMPPPSPPGLEGVDVVGHGLRITMMPPFQISLADDFVPGHVEKGATGGLILSWWNVTDPKVGGRTGFGALYNAGVAVHPAPQGDAGIVQTELPWPGGDTGVAYRLGESGSYVLLPPELLGSGGMLTVTEGPAEPSWAMEVDGVRTPLESGKIVHSADPAAGPPFEFDGRPHQPWGPWPE